MIIKIYFGGVDSVEREAGSGLARGKSAIIESRNGGSRGQLHLVLEASWNAIPDDYRIVICRRMSHALARRAT